MGLLDRATESFTVYPSTDDVDEFGAKRRRPGDPDSPGVEARGWIVNPAVGTASERGFDTTERMRLLSTDFPFGALSVVRWQGRLWDVEDEPVERRHSVVTRHTSCTISARTGVPR